VYMLSSPVVEAEQLNFSERDCETLQRTLFGTLWNVRAFYLMYAGSENIEITKPKSTHILDRWLMARLAALEVEMTEAMERYDLVAAIRPLRVWVDDLSTWWLRRSRERMKADNQYEKLDALRTLREALLDTAALLAPFAPFFAEKLYQDLGGAKMSVHLDKWPKADERVIDQQLLGDMAWARAVVTAGHEARATSKMPVRQALASASVTMRDAAEASRLAARTDLLTVVRDELNVERVMVKGGATADNADWVCELDLNLTPELKKKGMARELSRHIMNARKKLSLRPDDQIKVLLATVDHGHRDLFESLSGIVGPEVKAVRFDVVDQLAENQEAQASVEIGEAEVAIHVEKA